MMLVFRYRELIRNLVLKDLKLKYRDSALGFLWSLANPLLLIVVYAIVFTHMLRVEIANFPYFLLVGILPWNFFSQSLMMCTGSIVDNGGLIRKVWLPAEVFPLSTVLFNLVQFLLALVVLMPVAAFIFRISFSWTLIVFFPLLLLHAVFTLGLGYIISTLTVFYRDMRHFIEIFLMLLFWLTPIVYDIQGIPGPMRRFILANPLAFFISGYQEIFYYQRIPAAFHFLVLTLLTLTAFGLGYWCFCRYKARFPEEV